jgi:hypothetical protein
VEASQRRYGSFLALLRGERDLASHWRRRAVPADIILTLDGRVMLISTVDFQAGEVQPYVVTRHFWRPPGIGPGLMTTLVIGSGGFPV